MEFNLASILVFVAGVHASYFPPQPVNVTTLKSERTPGVSISYKETNICETTPGVKSYSGYVNLPASVLQLDYNISTFFWYFEARKHPQNAPLLIYLAGGPGESSLFGATAMGGPCYINDDSNSTSLNPWSFNNEANVLYIDEPAQTGFSYDVLVNGTLDLLTGTYTPADFSSGIPETNATFLVGTFPSQSPSQTSNSSTQAAHALYEFTQAWVNEFPKYNTVNKKINVWANSWGGFVAPATLAYFEQRNDQLKTASDEHETYTYLDIDTLGLLNGCVDLLYEAPHYPQYALNNTYDLPAITQDTYEQRLGNYSAPNGCAALLTQCREQAAQKDPLVVGNDPELNGLCVDALGSCISSQGVTEFLNRSVFDIRHFNPDPYPYSHVSAYFNKAWVQSALGVSLNFTAISNAVYSAIIEGTGDISRANKTHTEFLLSRGKRVVMVYGDRDYRCNWLGAENISLSLDFPGQYKFAASGYTELITNASYVGGVTRQAGDLSFNRVFESGHYAAGSQPETTYRIFERNMKNLDTATGKVKVDTGCGYQTTGPSDSWSWRNVLPAAPPVVCTIWDILDTCTPDQTSVLVDGTAVIQNDFVVSPAS